MASPRLFTESYCRIMAANFLLYFGFWILIPILPFYLKENYGISEGSIGLILSIYTLAALAVRPFSGYLLDTFARKPLYLFAYAVFTCIFGGYIVGGALFLFILFRMFHGLAFGAVTVGGNTLVIDIMPSERRGEGLGYYGLMNNFAMSVGPMTGLLLHGVLSYELIFGIGMATCLIGFLLALGIRTRKASAFSKSCTRGTTPPMSLDRFILLKGIPAGIALLLLSIPYGATTNFVAMYVKEMGLDVESGFFFVLLAAGMGISRIFSGKFVDKGYVTECIHNGFYLVIAAFALLGSCRWLIDLNESLTMACFILVPLLQGIGFGIMFPAYNTLYVNLASHNQRATATSTYLTSWDIGIGLGMMTGGYIAENLGFGAVYLTGAGLCLVSMIYFDRVVTPKYKRDKVEVS